MVGVDGKTVIGIQTVSGRTFLIDVGVRMDFRNAHLGHHFAHLTQQPRSVAFVVVSQQGYSAVDMQMVAVGQIKYFVRTAYWRRIVLAFLENTGQPIPGSTLAGVDLFDETVNVGQRWTQHAQRDKRGGGFFRCDLAQHGLRHFHPYFDG